MTDADTDLGPELSPRERVDALVRLLTLEDNGPDRFLGRRKVGGVGRIFGGQVVAQALAAAEATVDEVRPPHSVHAYFLRGGDEDFPIEFTVDRQFDGGSFSNRRVVASQKGRPILNMAASFHRREEGLHHQDPMPDVPPPMQTPSDVDGDRTAEGNLPLRRLRWNRAYEVRCPDGMGFAGRERIERPYMWFRILAPLPDDPRLHRAVLAYLSDYGLLSASRLRHTEMNWSTVVKGASLDHAIWFHADARVDEWLLYSFDSPWTGNARGFNRGSFYTQDGKLIASTAQEGLLRVDMAKL